MRTLEIEQAGAVADLVQRLRAGEEVVLTDQQVPVARVIRVAPASGNRRFGIARHLIRVHDDFETPLDDFEPYTH
jgi:antitoxin (DNA-binding transcriptional repressor) of toxin-antitoxin stability system